MYIYIIIDLFERSSWSSNWLSPAINGTLLIQPHHLIFHSSITMLKRRRNEDYDRESRKLTTYDIHMRVKREICEIGEPGRFDVSSSVDHLGRTLSSIDEDGLRSMALNAICAVVREQPHKIPLIAGSIQLANYSNSLIGQTVVEKVHSELQNALNEKNWRFVKLFGRFASTLIPIISGEGVYSFWESVLDKLVLNGQPDAVTDELAVGVMLALPTLYVTPKCDKERVKSLYEKVKNYTISSDEKKFDLMTPFTENGPYKAHNFVALVREALARIDNEEWLMDKGSSLGSLIRIDHIIHPLSDSGALHNFPALNYPENAGHAVSDKLYEFPRVYQQFYLPGKFQTVPPPDTLEAVFLRDLGSDIICGMDFNRKEVARQLITLDLFFAPGVFAEPGVTMDRLESKVLDLEQNHSSSDLPFSTWKIEDCALEIVLDHIFRLPHSIHHQVYYHSILIETCIMAPQAIAPVFGRAVRFLFNNLEFLDLDLYYRFLDWFSHHLTNFAFVWKWSEWMEFLERPEDDLKLVFIKQLIIKEVRLSYPQRVKESLPEEFAPLVPSESNLEVNFKYQDQELGYEEVVGDVQTAFKRAKSGAEDSEEELNNALESLREKVTSDSIGASADSLDLKMTDVLVSIICNLGNRSLTHVQDWINRAKSVLVSNVTDVDGGSKQAIDSVLEYWNGQPYIGTLVLRKFAEASVIDQKALIEKIVAGPLAMTSHGYELLMWLIRRFDAVQAVIEVLEAQPEPSTGQWWLKGLRKVLDRELAVKETLAGISTSVEADKLAQKEKDAEKGAEKDAEKESEKKAEKEASDDKESTNKDIQMDESEGKDEKPHDSHSENVSNEGDTEEKADNGEEKA